MNFGYDLGRYDQIGVLLLLFSIHALRARRLVFAGLLSGLGMLIHEAYSLLFFPVVLAVAWDQVEPGKHVGHAPSRLRRCRLLQVAPLLIPPILAMSFVCASGEYEPGHEALVRYFERVSPEHAGSHGIKIWTRTLDDNMSMARKRIQRTGAVQGQYGRRQSGDFR